MFAYVKLMSELMISCDSAGFLNVFQMGPTWRPQFGPTQKTGNGHLPGQDVTSYDFLMTCDGHRLGVPSLSGEGAKKYTCSLYVNKTAES